MTKTDLVYAVQDWADVPRRDALDILEGLLDIIKTTLEDGQDLLIPNFGKFEVKSKEERLGRNPHTGAPLTINARLVVKFKPSTYLKKCLNDGSTVTAERPLPYRKRGRVKKETWKQELLPL